MQIWQNNTQQLRDNSDNKWDVFQEQKSEMLI